MAKSKPEPLKLIGFEVKNVKRIRVVRIEPDGALTQIKGRNGEGKSSLIDSVAMLLGGKEEIPPEPVRRGATEAVISAELGTGRGRTIFRLERKIRPDGKTELKVWDAEGTPLSGPQTLLDSMVSRGLAFDPSAFMLMDARRQAEVLRKIAGLDFTDLEERRQKLYDQRTAANSVHRAAKARLDKMKPPQAGLPAKPVVLADLLAERDTRSKVAAENDARRQALQARKHDLARIDNEVEELEARLRSVRARAEQLRTGITEEEAAVAKLTDPDTADLDTKIANSEKINAAVRERDGYAAAEKESEKHAAESKRLTEDIEALDAEKSRSIEATKMPVKGLGFDAEGMVTLDGLPLTQASSAMQIRISTAIALAGDARCKVALIRNGALINAEGRRLIAEMAAKAGATVLMEIATEGGPEDGDDGSIVIEDGTLRASRELQAT